MPQFRASGTIAAAILVLGGTRLCESNDDWDYPNAGRTGVNEVSAGRAGQFRVFDCETTDGVEEVVLWYVDRMGIDADHRLVTAASEGFSKLDGDLNLIAGFGHDTDERQDNTQIIAHISTTHAHVTLLHRPVLNQNADVTISISQIPRGTSIHIIQPLPEAGTDN